MAYAVHKLLVFLKNHLDYLKHNIFECFFKKYNGLKFFFKNIFFFITYNEGKSKAWKGKIIKDIRNLSRPKKELKYTATKDIRNHFGREEKN